MSVDVSFYGRTHLLIRFTLWLDALSKTISFLFDKVHIMIRCLFKIVSLQYAEELDADEFWVFKYPSSVCKRVAKNKFSKLC